MQYAFICDDTRTYKGLNSQNMGGAIDFLFSKLNSGYEVRVVTFGSIPDGYVES